MWGDPETGFFSTQARLANLRPLSPNGGEARGERHWRISSTQTDSVLSAGRLDPSTLSQGCDRRPAL